MSNDSPEKVRAFVNKNKKSVLIFFLFVLGIIMLIFSSSVFSDENEEQKAEELVEYKAKLELELAEVCSSVSGVGRCKVTVSFERGEERIYKGSLLIESKPPKVMGVAVVCRGADSDKVRGEIVNIMCALFDIGANRVTVSKLNS